jgi:tetratricopeptide (TPR) repeat protein
MQYLKTWYIQTILLAFGVALVYGHTLDVPFYLDDFSSIQENPIIYNWQGTLAELWQFAALRIVGYLSFALNYQIHQFQVAGYHLVNILIHLLAGLTVFALLRGLVRTPTLNKTLSDDAKCWLPFIAALIFVLHPLQIQSVTYIVQRLASLAGFWYIGAMACFVQARLATKWSVQILWTFLCIILIFLAFFTKQHTVTLPIALLFLELIFFRSYPVRLKALVALLSFGIGLIGLVLFFEQNPSWLNLFGQNSLIHKLDMLSRETAEISRTSYLATQMGVLWHYISLFVSTASSHIDYDNSRFLSEGFLSTNAHYSFIARLLDSSPIWLMLGHLLLICLAVLSLRRLPLVAFSILFYYLAHLIESSVIPIRDIIFEHRTYLPNLGLAILSAWLLVVQLPKWLSKAVVNKLIFQVVVLLPVLLLLLTLGSATWLRNQTWRDPVALWQHNVEQSPQKQRGWIILGKHLVQRGQMEKEQGHTKQSQTTLNHAINVLKKAVIEKKHPDGSLSISVTPETALNLIVAYKALQQYEQALQWIKRALSMKHLLRPFDQAKFLVNQGNIFFEVGRAYQHREDYAKAKMFYQKSERSYQQAIQIYPQNLKAQINLASILGMTGRLNEAISLYQKILAINPSNTYVKENLHKLQAMQKKNVKKGE